MLEDGYYMEIVGTLDSASPRAASLEDGAALGMAALTLLLSSRLQSTMPVAIVPMTFVFLGVIGLFSTPLAKAALLTPFSGLSYAFDAMASYAIGPVVAGLPMMLAALYGIMIIVEGSMGPREANLDAWPCALHARYPVKRGCEAAVRREWYCCPVSKALEFGLFRLQNGDDLVEAVEIDKAHLLAVGLQHGANLGVLLLLRKVLRLVAQQPHHRLVLEAELRIVDPAPQMEDLRSLEHFPRELPPHAFLDVCNVLGVSRVRKANRRDSNCLALAARKTREGLLHSPHAPRVQRADIGDNTVFIDVSNRVVLAYLDARSSRQLLGILLGRSIVRTVDNDTRHASSLQVSGIQQAHILEHVQNDIVGNARFAHCGNLTSAVSTERAIETVTEAIDDLDFRTRKSLAAYAHTQPACGDTRCHGRLRPASG